MLAGGTLVVLVPAGAGIVLAADTRYTLGQTYCDGNAKLFVPKLRKNTIVFDTGAGLLFPLNKAHQVVDPCAYMKSTNPELDIPRFLLNQIDAAPKRILSQTEIEGIGRRCVAAIKTYAEKHQAAHPLDSLIGQHMFRAGIASYDAEHEMGLVGTFTVLVDAHGTPMLDDVVWRQILKSDKVQVKKFGETEYVERYVISSGQKLLSPYNALADKIVSQTSLVDATSAAVSLIAATEETAKMIKPPTGIGGPIDVATITKMGAVLERH